MSVVDTYLVGVHETTQALADPVNEMDQDVSWISINALILIGILNCTGSDRENAEVFYRIVQPELHSRILVFDKDVRSAMFFMTNMSTIMQQMQSQMLL